MARYKVPQDVEADDKLIGPFSFRQFVYLLIAAGCVALAVALFQLFPLLAIIPLPPVLLFLALALPLKKDQPMETYLAAVVSYYLKPRTRQWMPGQKETAILITAPKVVEDVRTRDLSQEEATHRLSFLADVVDSEGYSIRGGGNSMREDLVAEANATSDMFDAYNQRASSLDRAIAQDKAQKHEEAINAMRAAINESDEFYNAPLAGEPGVVKPVTGGIVASSGAGGATVRATNGMVASGAAIETANGTVTGGTLSSEMPASSAGTIANQTTNVFAPTTEKSAIIELANNPDYSVETIAKEAKRINRKDDEVFVSLH